MFQGQSPLVGIGSLNMRVDGAKLGWRQRLMPVVPARGPALLVVIGIEGR